MSSDDRLTRLNTLLSGAVEAPFQRARLDRIRLRSLETLSNLPLTTKQDLLDDQHANPPFGTNLTLPPDRYTRVHQTSGTTASSLRVLETPEDWRWWRRSLGNCFEAAGVAPGDRVALAYSFGPYIQFWASYEGVQEVGAMAIALGGMDAIQRLHTIALCEASALLCTPSYALRLAQVAAEAGLEAALKPITRVICTGEPGGSVSSIRNRIEEAWTAECFDHAGATEAGNFAYPCSADGGMHLVETDFICEILHPESSTQVLDGEPGELVVTCLERRGFPVIRYRTGDVVRASPNACSAGHPGRWMPDGIVGRVDDMMVIRGMNVFPSSIEETLRQVSGIGEFRITFYADPGAMDAVKVEAEVSDPSQVREIQERLHQHLGLRVRIVPLKPGILPQYDGKARRVEDRRERPAPADRRTATEPSSVRQSRRR
jgi:phenylacetate-CoA ligase